MTNYSSIWLAYKLIGLCYCTSCLHRHSYYRLSAAMATNRVCISKHSLNEIMLYSTHICYGHSVLLDNDSNYYLYIISTRILWWTCIGLIIIVDSSTKPCHFYKSCVVRSVGVSSREILSNRWKGSIFCSVGVLNKAAAVSMCLSNNSKLFIPLLYVCIRVLKYA